MRIFLVLLIMLVNAPCFATDLSNSVVTIRVIRQAFDHNKPWQKKHVAKTVLSGCVIENGRILTKAYPMANHVMVEVSKHGENRRYPAKVLLKDYNSGLALLRVNDPDFYEDLRPIQLAESGKIQKDATIARWDASGIFKTYKAEAFKVALESYETKSVVLIHYMITGMAKGGGGEPVFVDGKLVGITQWLNEREKTVKVMGVDSIRNIMVDLEDGNYDGQPFFWIGEDVELGQDENLRNYLGVQKEDTGVLVIAIPPKSSGYGVLKERDVILSIDGVNIDDSGYYESKAYGKLKYRGKVCLEHAVGDTVKMTIIRDRQKMTVSFKLLPFTEDTFLSPPFSFDQPPQYLVWGGLISQELSGSYLHTWGGKWKEKADKRLVYIYNNFKLWPTNERRRVVVLNRVLPAAINAGYYEKGDLILKRVNGISVKDLRHLKELIDKKESPFILFEFQGGESIVLNREKTEEVNHLILKRYNIPSPFYLRN